MIALAAAIGYFVESIFGFGGTVLFMALGGTLLDFKTLIYVALLAGMTASFTIVAYNFRRIVWMQLGYMLLLTAPGVVLGAYLVEHLEGALLLRIFALILIIFGLQGVFKPYWLLPRWAGITAIMGGGVAQGMFSTGGPVVILGMRGHFRHRQELRATMAAFFLLTNVWRLVQFMYHDSAVTQVMADHVWVVAPVVLAVVAGYWLHVRLSDPHYRTGLNLLFIAAGVAYLLR